MANRIIKPDSGNTLVLQDEGGSAALVIDTSGNVLVGTTSVDVANHTGTTNGVRIAGGSQNIQVASTTVSAYFNKLDTDGSIVEFRKSGTTVGSIGTGSGDLSIGTGDTGIRFNDEYNTLLPVNTSTNALADDSISLGLGTYRFKDIYATNGTIQTSDRNEKQDIEELSEAEKRVAVVAKGLLRKFRWKSSVSEKGEDARIHFGIIAQDLKSAFEAEGLDAGRYGMFIHSEWWETQTEVPAVEGQDAVIDDNGNVIKEAVEAQEAYTRIETYDTEAEAPEGAVKKDRMGVRYSELLAFIIAAI